MTNPDFEHKSEEPSEQLSFPGRSFERYDLTGRQIGGWRVTVRETLVAVLKKVRLLGKAASEIQLPDTTEQLGDKVKKLPGKAVVFLESQIQKAPIENQLKSAQTQTEFAQQELIRAQIENIREDTRGKKLSNLERELVILERICEITQGWTGIHFMTDGDDEIVVFGAVPNLPEDSSDARGITIGELGLPRRIVTALANAGIETIGGLQDLGRTRISVIEGIGQKSLAEIERTLAVYSVTLDD